MNLAWTPEVIGNYLRARDVAVVRGRDFTPADRDGAPLVVIVTMPWLSTTGADPMGKRLHRGPKEADFHG